MKAKRKFTVGQRIWEFDENRRRYPKDEKGRATGGAIYAEHFAEWTVTEITPRGYMIRNANGGWTTKISVKTAESYYSDQEREDKIWIWHHRYKISSLVESCRDADVLRKVASAIGYEATNAS